MIKLNDDLIWKGTGKKWHVSDMSIAGDDIISSEDGSTICEVGNEEDVSLIRKAPELLAALYKSLHIQLLNTDDLSLEEYSEIIGAFNLIKEICNDSNKNQDD